MSQDRRPPLHVVGDLPVCNEHYSLLCQQAFNDEIIRDSGVRSVLEPEHLPEDAPASWQRYLPGLLWTWYLPDGGRVAQLRPDTPPTNLRTGKLAKYLFPKGATAPLGVTRAEPGAESSLIVEGTKQGWVAAGYAPTGMAVYAIAGAQNWVEDGAPAGAFRVVRGTDVIVCLDADAGSNFHVYQAGVELRKACLSYGAASVRFVQLTGGRTSGLDDVLARNVPEDRPAMLGRFISMAIPDKPAPRKPSPKQRSVEDEGSPYFSETGSLLARSLAEDVLANNPAAISQEGTLALYAGGVYQVDRSAFTSAVARCLGEDYRGGHRSNAFDVAYALLDQDGRRLPQRLARPILNCANGLVDLVTGELSEHTPQVLSQVQIPISYDPQARCPHYEEWIATYAPGQVEDLEEVISTMLDPSRTPAKAILLFGPSRSGKSTLLRLMAAIAGKNNVSAVELAELSEDQFAAARIYGQMLNAAADLPIKHIDDLSMFKKLTGEDVISANRKYGGQFEFVNQALFAFSANEIPTVGESSRAYSERIKPFEFPRSFAGSETPEIEAEMMAELPGILSRWVSANQRLRARGRYAATDTEVSHQFETRSDRVRQWVDEECYIWTEEAIRAHLDPSEPEAVFPGAYLPQGFMTPKRDLARGFNQWAARATGGAQMAERKVLSRLTSMNGVCEVRKSEKSRRGQRGLNITIAAEGPKLEAEKVPHEALLPSTSASGSTPNLPRSQPSAKDMRQKRQLWDQKDLSEDTHIGLGNQSVTHRLLDGQSVTVQLRKSVLFHRNGSYGGTSASCDQLPPSVDPRAGSLVFDIETASASELFSSQTGFVRLAGYTDPQTHTVTITEDPAALVSAITASSAPVAGHNILGFDLLALAHHHGLDLLALAEADRIRDTRVLAMLADPPPSGKRGTRPRGYYSLDATCQRYQLPGKTDDLAGLAKRHGGFNQIPTDDPEFRNYLIGDVHASAALLAEAGEPGDYARREHRVIARIAQTSLSGFRVDTELLNQRLDEGRARREALIETLHTEHGLPITNAKGKPYASPHATAAGKAAIEAALSACGVTVERTATGEPALGKTALETLARRHAENPAAVELLEMVRELNGVRTVYGTVADNLVGDRVHPLVWPRQASGRWSVTAPGLTVFGKRDGKVAERAIFLPEPGEVLLAADLDQIDMRAVAALSGDRDYQRLFDPDRDAHAEIAEQAFGDRARREEAKAIGHGWNYGRGAQGIANGTGVDLETAIEFCRNMRQRFPDVVAWQTQVREQAEAGQLLDNGFGRPMRCEPEDAYTQAPALMGQGCARDLLMEGVLRLPVELIRCLRTVVHDELVFSVPAGEADEAARQIQHALSFEWRGVSMTAGVSRPGANWAQVYGK